MKGINIARKKIQSSQAILFEYNSKNTSVKAQEFLTVYNNLGRDKSKNI